MVVKPWVENTPDNNIGKLNTLIFQQRSTLGTGLNLRLFPKMYRELYSECKVVKGGVDKFGNLLLEAPLIALEKEGLDKEKHPKWVILRVTKHQTAGRQYLHRVISSCATLSIMVTTNAQHASTREHTIYMRRDNTLLYVQTSIPRHFNQNYFSCDTLWNVFMGMAVVYFLKTIPLCLISWRDAISFDIFTCVYTQFLSNNSNHP